MLLLLLPPADTLLPILTVEEMLLYTAELKQSRRVPLADKQAAVEELLDKLALLPCRSVPAAASGFDASWVQGLWGLHVGMFRRKSLGLLLCRVLSGLVGHLLCAVNTHVHMLTTAGFLCLHRH